MCRRGSLAAFGSVYTTSACYPSLLFYCHFLVLFLKLRNVMLAVRTAAVSAVIASPPFTTSLLWRLDLRVIR